jgi:hypothetical protein
MYDIISNNLSTDLKVKLEKRLDTNHDPLHVYQYVDNLLQHVVNELPQKTLTNRFIPTIIKLIDEKCTKKLFRGGSPNMAVPVHPEHYNQEGQYVENPVFTVTSSIDFSNNIGRQSLGMYGGGNKKQNDLLQIARYISLYLKKKNKTSEKNAKYELASYIYMKLHCLSTKSNSSKKLLSF